MTLSYTGDTPEDLLDELTHMMAETKKDVRAIMMKGGADILQASKDMTPVDKGNLEEEQQLDVITDDGVVLSLEISVGGMAGDIDVDEYAAYIHEGLLPFGSGFAGEIAEKSIEKNASNPPDRPVGGKFLERAVDLFEEKIMVAIAAAMPGD